MKKILTIILDGFGYSEEKYGNAIEQANIPFLKKIWKEYPNILIKSSGNASGLPEGEMGTSESGHITIGAGRIIWQPLEEINQSIATGDFFKNENLLKYFDPQKNLHLVGMLSDGGVHSHIEHLYAMMKIAKEKGILNLYIHCIGDGRDVDIASIEKYLFELENKITEIGAGKISDLIGRFYAMDRDNNWDRTDKAFNLYTKGEGEICDDINKIANIAYKKEKNDYYIEAIKFKDFKEIKKEDNIIFFNFRADRAIQLTQRFYENSFNNFLAFGPYTDKFPVLFSPQKITNNISEVLSKNNKTQLRIAETEKYSHVTFYLNSQNHEKQKGEDHILIDSPKVPNYADKPEMSALEVTKKLIEEIQKNKYDVIFCNFANADLVGHSGILEAGIKAVETLDNCLSQIIEIAQKNSYEIIVCADHGNVEMMKTTTGENCATHTTNPVRFLLISTDKLKLKNMGDSEKPKLTQFGLKDIAPTILDLLGIEIPKEMTGVSMIEK